MKRAFEVMVFAGSDGLWRLKFITPAGSWTRDSESVEHEAFTVEDLIELMSTLSNADNETRGDK
jgi:hypothetical protein